MSTSRVKRERTNFVWHRQCSVLLKDQVDRVCLNELSQIHQRWLGYCEGRGVVKQVYNPIMIAVCSAVFDYLMQKVVEQHKCEQTESGSDQSQAVGIQEDSDDVYYRFGGAALAAMLHLRYDKLKTAPNSEKDTIRAQITVLKAIQCTDKSHIPEYLQYRDMGHMYFPDSRYIPFLKEVDKCVLTHANASSFKQHGSKLVEVASEQVRLNPQLESHFTTMIDEDNC